MSPVTGEATGLDWLKALRLPALLVSGSYLGAISHALTAAETLRAHGVPLLGLVVCASPDAPTPPDFVAAAIARHQAVPVVVIARDGDCPVELADLVRPAPGA
jgi:dethiobiotin synthetase